MPAGTGSLLKNHQVPVVVLNACQSGKQAGSNESSVGDPTVIAGVAQILNITREEAEKLLQDAGTAEASPEASHTRSE